MTTYPPNQHPIKVWWGKLLSNYNPEPVEIIPEKGEKVSPLHVKNLERQGFVWNEEREWWQRVWITSHPNYRFPNFRQIWETHVFDPEKEEWTYRIINPECLGGLGGGGHGAGWCIWEDTPYKED